MRSLLYITIGLISITLHSQNIDTIKINNPNKYYHSACIAAKKGYTNKALTNLNIATNAGWHYLKQTQNDPDLKSLHLTKEWNNIITRIKANRDLYEKDFDKTLKCKLERIYIKDQTLRQLYSEAMEKFKAYPEMMDYFWDLMNTSDSLNLSEIIKILNDKGWVGKSLVGEQGNMTIFLVIQHAPLDIQEKYLPLMEESVKKGESNGSNLALLVDRIKIRHNEPQIYGSQISYDSETDKYYVDKIVEPEYVNQRRFKIGLGPIQDYVKKWDIKWTIKQKSK